MAIKAALAAALLVALVAAAAATYTTTITTVSVDEQSPSYQQCSQQVQGRQFRSCQRYLQQGHGSPYNRGQQQDYLQECCQQLQEVDRYQCGCEAIKQVVRQVQQGGSGYLGGQSEQIYQRARELPRQCNLSQQQCRFSVVFV